MTEQQLETLEKFFPHGGMIVMKEPNGTYRSISFGPQCDAMDELVDRLVEEDDGALLLQVLNKHYPAPPKDDEGSTPCPAD